MIVIDRETAQQACKELRLKTEEKLRATNVLVRFDRNIGKPDVFHVWCMIESRPFEFHWEAEVWKSMPSDFDWDGLLLEARPIR